MKMQMNLTKTGGKLNLCLEVLKTRGFNIEQTHLSDLKRLEKLFSVVIIAFVWGYKVGLFLQKIIEQIRMLKHGYWAKNFVKIWFRPSRFIQ